MNKAFVKARTGQLTELEKQLTQELEWLQQSAAPVTLDQTQFGRLSRMDAISQQEMQKAAVEQSRKRLRRVKVALRKLDEEDYGWCDLCGDAIEPRRLEVQPEAAYCLKCQDTAERGD